MQFDLPRVLAVVAAAGCAEAPEPSGPPEAPYLDFTVEIPPPPEGGVQVVTPILEIPPFTEARTCNFDTYTGPDMGVVWAMDYDHPAVTHHKVLLDVHDEAYADGEIVNCEVMGTAVMDVYGLFIEGGGPEDAHELEVPGPVWDVAYWEVVDDRPSMISLPDGVAFPLRNGQRWAIDFHLLNPYDKPVRTNGGFNLGLVPVDEVEVWAGVGMFDSAPFELPTGPSILSFDCAFDHQVTIQNIQPHMHDYGAEFRVEVVRANGTVEEVLAVEDWEPWMKTDIPFYYFEPGTLVVEAGDALRTVCRWDNPTGEPLPYPVEMCTTSWVGFPLEEGMVCFGNRDPEPYRESP